MHGFSPRQTAAAESPVNFEDGREQLVKVEFDPFVEVVFGDSCGLKYRNPGGVFSLDHGLHSGLDAGVLREVFVLQVVHEEEVVPDVVVFFHVLLEGEQLFGELGEGRLRCLE